MFRRGSTVFGTVVPDPSFLLVTSETNCLVCLCPDFSDYKEHKLTEENIGFKLLQKAGWDEGAGLGAQKQGITAPVNK